MSDIELKPCPFCGGEAQLVRDRIGLWRVGCKKCNCMTTYQFDFGEGEEASQKKAVNVWNTRKPMERVVELVPDIEDIVRTYKQPPYGREVQGTVELLEEILGIVKGGAE